MNYKDSLDFLFAQLPMFSRVGAAAYKPGLDTSLALDDFFGHPHRKFKSIHIAGTNGKGSTSHMLAAILQSQGYKVGLYTSPHLADFRERIRINGEMIPQGNVIDFVDRWRNCGYEGHPSFFELTMMMAFDYFAREGVDYAVIEVGMGGRLDSTNIITPIGCVITNISPDHTQFLGDTLPKIASEKAGIIKTDIPVIIGEAAGEVREVFERRAAEVGAPITFAQDVPELRSIECELTGDYQKWNINTVLAAVDMLREAGVKIDDSSLADGMLHVCDLTGFKGRWMKTSESPLTYCDTGHNIAGLSYTMPQLERVRSERGGLARLVIGFVNDKDVAHIVNLLPKDGIYYVSEASVPRAMTAEQVAEILHSARLDIRSIRHDVKESYAEAAAESDLDKDVIYVGGSTFVVADYLVANN